MSTSENFYTYCLFFTPFIAHIDGVATKRPKTARLNKPVDFSNRPRTSLELRNNSQFWLEQLNEFAQNYQDLCD